MGKFSKEKMKAKPLHKISAITFGDNKLNLIIDGQSYEFLLSKISDRLAKATAIELENYKISPSGYGIHWPLLDEDLSIDGLLKAVKPLHKTSHREKV